MNLSYLIMAYNEEENIAEAIENAHKICSKVAKKFEILILYSGCSSDNTEDIIKEKMLVYPEVEIVYRPNDHWGYGYGLAKGIKAAKYDNIFFTDGDNQFDVNEIPLLIPHLKKYDIVMGKRKDRQDPLSRKIYSTAYNLFIDLLFFMPYLDMDCAFKIFKRKIFKDMKLVSETGFLNSEIIIKARRAGYKIKVVPVTHLPRLKGQSCVSGTALHKLWIAKDLVKEILGLRRNA
jgi:glycosyltransferase involved in cell wall biosynthesis